MVTKDETEPSALEAARAAALEILRWARGADHEHFGIDVRIVDEAAKVLEGARGDEQIRAAFQAIREADPVLGGRGASATQSQSTAA